MLFCAIGATCTMLMFFVQPGWHWWAGLLFLTANLAFGASIVFYNAYLPIIASEDQRDRDPHSAGRWATWAAACCW